MHGHYRPSIESRAPGVEWSRDRWRHLRCEKKGTKKQWKEYRRK